MDEVVGVQQKNLVSFTYHPELTNDEYYLDWLKQFTGKVNMSGRSKWSTIKKKV